MPPPTDVRKVALLGLPISALTMDEVVATCDRAIQERVSLLISVVNAAKVVMAHCDETLCQAVRCADVILADGLSVVWGSRLLRQRLPERVAGIDLMFELLKLADKHSYRVYFLGTTEEVLTEAMRRMKYDYPGVQFVGQRNGYFGDDEEPAITKAITAARPDMLFVATNSPKKELFMARWGQRMGIPVCHGVGAALDVVAGKVKRAPERWQRLGLEWLYRVIQEPRRLWRRYLVTNTLFCGMVLLEFATMIGASKNGDAAAICGRGQDCDLGASGLVRLVTSYGFLSQKSATVKKSSVAGRSVDEHSRG